jgi:hypothetical protein
MPFAGQSGAAAQRRRYDSCPETENAAQILRMHSVKIGGISPI